jgi:hypothetical protein
MSALTFQIVLDDVHIFPFRRNTEVAADFVFELKSR